MFIRLNYLVRPVEPIICNLTTLLSLFWRKLWVGSTAKWKKNCSVMLDCSCFWALLFSVQLVPCLTKFFFSKGMVIFLQRKCEELVYLLGRKSCCSLNWTWNWCRIISEQELVLYCMLEEITQKFQVWSSTSCVRITKQTFSNMDWIPFFLFIFLSCVSSNSYHVIVKSSRHKSLSNLVVLNIFCFASIY